MMGRRSVFVQKRSQCASLLIRKRQARPFLGSMLAVCLVVLTSSFPAITQAVEEVRPGFSERPLRALILHSYHADFSWTANIMQGMRETLKAVYPLIDLSIEYMDSKRYNGDLNGTYMQHLTHLYMHKYTDMTFDLILASDDNAFQFLLTHHHHLFPETPILFCGVNHFEDSMLAGHPNVTGILEVLDLAPTLELALRLNPGITQVAVISDPTPTGIGNRNALEAVIPLYTDRVTFRFLNRDNNLTLPELIARVESLEAQSTIILFLDFFRDKHGRYLALDQVLPLIASRAKVPIYSHTDLYLGYGILGGKLKSSYHLGKTAAERGIRILRGVPVKDIPLHRQGINKYMFDYAQLRRFGINISQLPVGSLVVNKPFSLYEEYTEFIWSIMVIIVSLVAIIVIVIKDNVLLKRAEAEIRQLNATLESRVQQRTADLETANRELKDFAHIVSHDLKAPLRGINQLVQWLVTDYADALDDQGKEIAELLINRVKRMNALINGVLQYARAGQSGSTAILIDLNRLITDVIDSLAPPDHIRIHIAPDLPSIAADSIHITQVFQNLLNNAIKFMDKPEGQISITYTEENTCWTFRITDNGPGIDAAHHERIFQVFQTITPSDNCESTGIGLSIVKKIVEGYGGTIRVESTPGQGSVFIVTFPKA